MSSPATSLPVVLVDLDDVDAAPDTRAPAVVVARWQGRPLGAVVHPGSAESGVADIGVGERFRSELERWRLLVALGAVEPLGAEQDSAVGAGVERIPTSAEGAEIVTFVPTGWKLGSRWAAALEDAFADPLVMAVRGAALPHRVAPDGVGALTAELRQRTVDGTRTHARAARPWQADVPLVVRRAFLAQALGPDPTAWDGAAVRATVPPAVLRAGYQLASAPAAIAWRPTRAAPADRLRWPAIVRRAAGRETGVGPCAAQRGHAAAATRRPGGPPVAVPAAGARPPTRPAAALPAAAPTWRGVERLPELSVVVPTGQAAERLPALSVVVPTRGRRELLLRLLRALDDQSYPDARLEIVVCADGDVDGSVTAMRCAGLRRHPSIVELAAPGPRRGNGAGVARNAAAARCEGELLLFLDDDVIPVDDGVLLAHARAAAGGPAAVVGPALPRLGGAAGIHEQRLRNWWARYSAHLASGGERTFADACTSNLSLPRTAFEASGGFSDLPRREDWELGYRLALAGVPVRGVPEAAVIHDADLRLRHGLRARSAEGAGDVAFARAHPEALGWLPLAALDDLPPAAQAVARCAVRLPALQRGASLLGPPAAALLDRAGGRPAAAAVLSALVRVAYWSGVGAASGGPQALRRLLADGRQAARTGADLDLDSPSWPSPAADEAAPVTVRRGPTVLGPAPLWWGGSPWDRRVFVVRTVGRYARP